ncbi:MAG: hypothetical protein ACJ76N_13445 [Thermoanaerobaculia bacterium]
MKDTLLNQALMNAGSTTKDGEPDPGDCCTVPPGGGDPGPGGPTG